MVKKGVGVGETRKSIGSLVASTMPLAIIAGLLYAALFIKPASSGGAVPEPVYERRDRLYGISVGDDGSVVAVGSGGKILLGDIKGGAGSIAKADSGTKETLQAVARWDELHLVAVGNEGEVVVSADHGRHWEAGRAPKSAVANRLVKVIALPEGIAFAVGEYNALLKSSDYGKTWQRLLPEKDAVIYGLARQGDHLLAVGEFGRVLLSADQGATWSETQAPVKANLTAVVFGNDGLAVAVGLNGTLLSSHDHGRSWSVVPASVEEHLYDVIWDGKRFVAVGDRATVLASGDGTTWEACDTGLGNAANYLWFTQLAPVANTYALAGSGIALMDGNYRIQPLRR
jgi:photosystem II stability/assembly factor-like uncharacterized protein